MYWFIPRPRLSCSILQYSISSQKNSVILFSLLPGLGGLPLYSTGYSNSSLSTDQLHKAHLYRRSLEQIRFQKLPTVVSNTEPELSPTITCATGYLPGRDRETMNWKLNNPSAVYAKPVFKCNSISPFEVKKMKNKCLILLPLLKKGLNEFFKVWKQIRHLAALRFKESWNLRSLGRE